MTGAYLVASLIAFSLLYAAQLYLNRNFIMKIINVTVLVFISSAVYFTFETYKGWPTFEPQHSKARLLAVVIEPPVRGEHEGGIYYWVIEKKREPSFFNKIFRYDPELPGSPRSYFLPYSEEAEKRFSEAQANMDRGNIVFVDPAGEQNGDQGKGQGKSKGEGDKQGSENDGTSGGEKNYDVPTLDIVTPDEYMRKN